MALPPDASVNEYISAWFKRVRSGQSGVLPVVGGLIAIIVIFQIEDSKFLTALNFANLLQQAAAFVVLGMAEIFVLLLGEIDLSLGYSGAVGAAVIAAVAGGQRTVPWWAAASWPAWRPRARLRGAAGRSSSPGCGLPSFVVTLAGYLAPVRRAAVPDRLGREHRQRRRDPAEQQRSSTTSRPVRSARPPAGS